MKKFGEMTIKELKEMYKNYKMIKKNSATLKPKKIKKDL